MCGPITTTVARRERTDDSRIPDGFSVGRDRLRITETDRTNRRRESSSRGPASAGGVGRARPFAVRTRTDPTARQTRSDVAVGRDGRGRRSLLTASGTAGVLQPSVVVPRDDNDNNNINNNDQ